jgi:mannuronan 5-epimerase
MSLKVDSPLIQVLCLTAVLLSWSWLTGQIQLKIPDAIASGDRLSKIKPSYSSNLLWSSSFVHNINEQTDVHKISILSEGIGTPANTSNLTSSAGSLTKNASASKCLENDETERTITISCNVSFLDMAATIDDENVIKIDPIKEGEWFLNSSIVILKGATLSISIEDGIKWVKINSEGARGSYGREGGVNESSTVHNAAQTEEYGTVVPHRIEVLGSIHINGTKITSWDPLTNQFTGQSSNGNISRPYIAIEEEADPSYIINSEIAYLGYNGSTKHGLNFHGGDGTILAGNNIHHLWFGVYTEGVGYMRIENNSIHDHIVYGLDPHTGTHHLTVKNNNITNSTTGLICSIDCYNLVFENNQIHDNTKVGLMFSKNTSNSIARYNNISNSYTGISVSESDANQVYRNTISDNKFGIQVKQNSSDNAINNNTITKSLDCGIAASAEARLNSILYNQIYDTEKTGICLTKAASSNYISSNLIDSANRFGISVRGQDVIGNIFESNIIRLVKDGIMVHNNTGTRFVNNIQNEIIGNEYTVSANSTLNLEKNPTSNFKIKSAGTVENMVKIQDSGKLEVFSSAKKTETEQDVASRTIYDSDQSTFIERISPATIIEIN